MSKERMEPNDNDRKSRVSDISIVPLVLEMNDLQCYSHSRKLPIYKQLVVSQ